MINALLRRTRRAQRQSGPVRRAVGPDPLVGWLLSRPVSRQLVIDILRAHSTYEQASPIADAHAAHIRALRRGRRSDAQCPRSTHPPSRRSPAVVAVDADHWSRRVPPVVAVDAEQYQSLLDQVQELRRLADEVTRLQSLDANHRVHETKRGHASRQEAARRSRQVG